MFDINKTIMRCLTKNLAMFGLGLYIYAGEDLPETEEDEKPQQKATPAPKKAATVQESQNYRTLLREYIKDFNLDGNAIAQACGLNNDSTDQDFAIALMYAKSLAGEGGSKS